MYETTYPYLIIKDVSCKSRPAAGCEMLRNRIQYGHAVARKAHIVPALPQEGMCGYGKGIG